MDKQKAIQTLNTQLKIIDDLLNKRADFRQWKRDTKIAIEKIFGSDTKHLTDLNNISYSINFGFSTNNFYGDIILEQIEEKKHKKKVC